MAPSSPLEPLPPCCAAVADDVAAADICSADVLPRLLLFVFAVLPVLLLLLLPPLLLLPLSLLFLLFSAFFAFLAFFFLASSATPARAPLATAPGAGLSSTVGLAVGATRGRE